MLNERGQIIPVVIVVVGIVLVSVLLIIAGAELYFQNATYSAEAEKTAALAEAGVDKAIASLNKTGGSYSGENETLLGEGSFSVTISSLNAATKLIQSTGYLPDKTNPRVKRTVKIQAARGVGASFVYGIQVGEGGLQLGNSNEVTGSVYSNGRAVNGNLVSGDIWVAGGPQPTADQQSECEGSNCNDFIFGKTVSGDDRLDVAQSFQSSSSAVLNKISLKIKKFGNPADIAVKVLRDNSDKPDKNQVVTSGTLYNSLAVSSYGWIDVTFDTLANLTQDTPYWIVLDTSSDSQNYWSWQNDLAGSYTRGQAKWSPNWQVGNPTWNNISGDLGFKVYMGGSPTLIEGGQNFNIGGSAHANTIKNATIAGDAYYQVISNSTAKNYHPNSADPPPKVFPISDANAEEWEAQATSAGVTTGDINNCVSTLERGKIVGNVTFNSNCNVTVQTPIWITGNLTLNSNNELKLASEYGYSSGVIIVDGIVTLGSNNKLEGTGTGSSILMILSNYDSRTSGISAIVINNTGNSGVFYASKGIIEPGNKNSFKELTGWGIKLINNGVINYETGLSSTLFSSGPSGSYTLVKGTYQLK